MFKNKEEVKYSAYFFGKIAKEIKEAIDYIKTKVTIIEKSDKDKKYNKIIEDNKKCVAWLIDNANKLFEQTNELINGYLNHFKARGEFFEIKEIDDSAIKIPDKVAENVDIKKEIKNINKALESLIYSLTREKSKIERVKSVDSVRKMNKFSDNMYQISSKTKTRNKEFIESEIEEEINVEFSEEVENVKEETIEESPISKEEKMVEKLKIKNPTLRQKFDINNEEDFNRLLSHYAKANKEYYSNNGKKRSSEEIKKRRNMNAQFKRILEKKAKQMPQNENGEDFSTTLKSIEKCEMFSQAELKEVAENKNATMKLFNIMASGVYESGGERIRLTQKQRVALASMLEKVSEIRLDMDNSKRVNKETSNINSEKEANKTSGQMGEI